MHNLFAIFEKNLEICKQFSYNLVNEQGNMPRRGTVPRFSDLEVVALNLTAESVAIDSESWLFFKLGEYKSELPHLISRRQYIDRYKSTFGLCQTIRERIVHSIDSGESYFCVDSKPVAVCRTSRGKRCKMEKTDYQSAPEFGYCASQGMYYYGYKLHAICVLNGVIHTFDLTKASVHDIHYVKEAKVQIHGATLEDDRGYISAAVQLDLFETANIFWRCLIAAIRNHANLFTLHLPKHAKGLKQSSHNCATSLCWCATTLNKPQDFSQGFSQR